MPDRWRIVTSSGSLALNASFSAEQYEPGGVDGNTLNRRDGRAGVTRVGDGYRTPAPFRLSGFVWSDDQVLATVRDEVNAINRALRDVRALERVTSAGVTTYAGLSGAVEVSVKQVGAALVAVAILVWPSSTITSFEPGESAGPAGVIVTTGWDGGRLARISADGAILWNVQIGAFSGYPAIGPNGEIYVGLWDAMNGFQVGRYDSADGSPVWVTTSKPFHFVDFCAVDNDGHPIWSLNDTGGELQRHHRDTGALLASGVTGAEYSWRVAVASDGRVYAGGRDPNVARLNADLTNPTEIVSGNDYQELYNGFTMSPENAIYVAGNGFHLTGVSGTVVARLDSAGALQWFTAVNPYGSVFKRTVEARQNARVYANLLDDGAAQETKTHAFDAATGAQLWEWVHPNYDSDWEGGLADAGSAVFVSDPVNVYQLDPITGDEVTSGGWPVAFVDARWLAPFPE